MELHEMVSILDTYLSIHAVEDECNNGLQVESGQDIKRAAFAVDACMEVFEKAVHEQCQLVIVHHGLIWGGLRYVRGDVYRRVKYLVDHDMGLYAAHVPLDIHKEVGNNVQMASLLGMEVVGEFCPYKNIKIGALCRTNTTIEELAEKVEKAFGRYVLWKCGGDNVRTVGIVTGAGFFALDAALEAGCDTFVTGETKHGAYHKVKENQITVVCAGHYQTETLGVRALMASVKEKYDVETVFIDAPTGL